MNRQQFLTAMHHYLSPMAELERSELMRDYEAHFTFGLQSGKTEQEIVRELGDPMELAAEALGTRVVAAVPWQKNPGNRAARMISMSLLLFFINSIILPLIIGLWAVLVGLAASALASLLSPVAVLLDWLINDSFMPAMLFASIGLVGIGILLVYITVYAAKGWVIANAAYYRWTVRMWKGSVE